jgi:hypothetical protein
VPNAHLSRVISSHHRPNKLEDALVTKHHQVGTRIDGTETP